MQKLNYAIATSAAVAMLAAVPVFADMNSSSLTISNNNSGAILNETTASASTGGNWAGGSFGGDGGLGGDVAASGGSGNNGGATAGDGGDGGDAGAGGYVETGDATADAGTANALNTNDVDVAGEGDVNSSAIVIDGTSSGAILNSTRAKARTGYNDAEGSLAGAGGDGGVIDASLGASNSNGGAIAGSGGAGGDGDIGGTVLTGESLSTAGTINVMNTNLVRVRH